MCIGLAIVVNGTVIKKLAALMAQSGENRSNFVNGL